MRLRYSLSILALGLLLAMPGAASAAIITQQPDHSTAITQNTFGNPLHVAEYYCFNPTGGLTGNFDTLRMYFSNVGGSAGVLHTRIDEVTGAGCTGSLLHEYEATTTIAANSGAQAYDFTARQMQDCAWNGSGCSSITYNQGFTFNPAHYYLMSNSGAGMNVNTTGTNLPQQYGSSTIAVSYAYIFSDTPFVVDTSTHIETVTPDSGSTIATSTAATFGATGYVNPADFVSGMYIELKYARYSSYQASVASPDLLFTTIHFPITASGSFTFSTTSPAVGVGQYKMTTTISTPSLLKSILNWWGLGNLASNSVKSATSTVFTADHLSGYDIYVASTTAMLEDYIASSTISLASCSSWTQFNLGDCLNLLFVPQTQPIAAAFDNFKQGFLSFVPWGYLTRFVVILSGSATSTLPSFTATIPISASEDTSLTFDMNDMIAGGGTLLNSIHDNDNDMSAEDIIEPWIKLMVALFVVLIIVQDVTRMSGASGGGGALAHGRE